MHFVINLRSHRKHQVPSQLLERYSQPALLVVQQKRLRGGILRSECLGNERNHASDDGNNLAVRSRAVRLVRQDILMPSQLQNIAETKSL